MNNLLKKYLETIIITILVTVLSGAILAYLTDYNLLYMFAAVVLSVISVISVFVFFVSKPKKGLLLLEDNSDFINDLKKFSEKHLKIYELQVVKNVEDAKNSMKSGKFKVIIIDLDLGYKSSIKETILLFYTILMKKDESFSGIEAYILSGSEFSEVETELKKTFMTELKAGANWENLKQQRICTRYYSKNNVQDLLKLLEKLD
jgi:Na+/melibiose symporter-like transporter